jgi:hypothetical protein
MISFSWRFDFALFPTVVCRDTHQHHPENQHSNANADQSEEKKNNKIGRRWYLIKKLKLPFSQLPMHDTSRYYVPKRPPFGCMPKT